MAKYLEIFPPVSNEIISPLFLLTTSEELECSEDRKSITSLSQVLSLYTDRQQDPDQQTFSDSSERSSQLTVGSVSSQDTTLDMEIPNYQDYDHLDHTRSVNDMSPNYCQY